MRTFNYLTLILSFTLLFASCKKESPEPTSSAPVVEEEYTIDMVLEYSGDLRDGSIVKYNDKDGVEKQEILDKTKTEWKKTIVVKKGFTVFIRGEFNIAIGKSYEFKAMATGHKKDGSIIFNGDQELKPSGVTKDLTVGVQYSKTI